MSEVATMWSIDELEELKNNLDRVVSQSRSESVKCSVKYRSLKTTKRIRDYKHVKDSSTLEALRENKTLRATQRIDDINI